VVISVLVVALIYSSTSAFNVFGLVPDEAPSNAECHSFGTQVSNLITWRCCWTETDPNDPDGIELYWCQYCTRHGCDPKKPASQGRPTGPAAPLQEGVLEQPEQPPLFGRNEAAVPPTGGIVQPFTSTTPPLFGNVPLQGGFGILQEPETPPTFGQVAPQGQVLQPLTPAPGEGGEQAQSSAVSPTGYCASSIRTSCIPCDPGLPVADCTPASEWPPVLSADEGLAQGTQPPLKTIPPLGEIAPEAEQPEAQEQEEQPQDDGQEEPSNEGQETAGPLT
jgi:hypothetical protein